jgi:GT2 family glycosyltransferase
MIDFSVIIVSWNAQHYLMPCLDSLFETVKNRPFEVFVVDNASTDGSPEAVEERYPSVTVIRNTQNLGFAKANNIALKQSVGKYLFLINSDVKILDGCIEEMIQFMDHHSEAGLAGPKILNSDGSLQPHCRYAPSRWNTFCETVGLHRLGKRWPVFSGQFMLHFPHDTVCDVEVLSGCFWVVRKTAFDQVGGLDEGFFFYGEDIDWCCRYRKMGWKVLFNPKARAIHYGGGSSENSPIRFYLELQRADLQYWLKHHGRFGRFYYACMILLRQGIRMAVEGVRFSLNPSLRNEAKFKIKRAWATIRYVVTGKGLE